MSKKIVVPKAAIVCKTSSKKMKNVPKNVPNFSEEEIQVEIDARNKGVIIPSILLGTPKGRNALLKKEVTIPFRWCKRVPDHLRSISDQGFWSGDFSHYELNMKLAEMHRDHLLPKDYICKLLRAGIIEDKFDLLSQIFKTQHITEGDLVIFDQIAKLVSPLMKVPRPELPITTYDILVFFFSAHHDQVPASSIEKVVEFFKEHDETITTPMFAQVCAAGRLTEHKLKQMLRLGLDLNRKVGSQMMHNVIYSNANAMDERNVVGFLSHGNDISELIKILQLIERTMAQ